MSFKFKRDEHGKRQIDNSEAVLSEMIRKIDSNELSDADCLETLYIVIELLDRACQEAEDFLATLTTEV